MKIIIRFIVYLFLGLLSVNNNSMINTNLDYYCNDYYFGISIPKINLEQKVYQFGDEKNDVNKGIYLVKDYEFNNSSGSLILASHSGNSSISYFRNLDKLENNDIVKIIYNYKTYYFQIFQIYKINKTGSFSYEDKNDLIYLITCDKNNRKKQVIFMGKLVKITKKSTFF